MYHRIAEAPALRAMPPELASATPEGLERQIAALAARRPIVSLADVVAARRGERALPDGAVTVTFDDAYRDFADHAWPVFRRLGVPVTLFVATAFPDDADRVYWWDRLDAALAAAGGHREIRTAAGTLPLGTPGERRAAYRRLTAWVGTVTDDEAMAEIDRVIGELGAPAVGSDVLGWDRLRELHAEGVTLASHSHTHALLQRVPLDRAVSDVATSLATLERELGTAPAAGAGLPGRRPVSGTHGCPARRRHRGRLHHRARRQRPVGRRLDGAEPAQRGSADDAGDPARAAPPEGRPLTPAAGAAAASMEARMTFEPVWMGDLELAEPIGDLEPPRDHQGAPYRHARLLVQVHGTPVALVHVDLDDGRCAAARLVAQVNAEAGDRVAAHLLDDGLPAAELGVGGLPAVADAPCVAPGPCVERGQGLASVIVCTRDRSESLRIALTSILASERGDFEVVVVDNAPATDATRTVVDDLADPRLRYVLEPCAGLSRARNRGALEARGGLLAFTDDDVRVEPTWLGRLLTGFTRAPHVGCVTGLVVAAELETAPQAYFEYRISWSTLLETRYYDLGEHGSDDPMYPFRAGRFGTGASFAVDRETWFALEGVDPLLGAGTPTMGGEDLDLFLRVLLSGRALAVEPRAVVWHWHRRELEQLRRQMYGYGTGLAAYGWKHMTSRRTGPGIARRVPAAVHGIVRDARGAGTTATVDLDLSAVELRGLVAGAPIYIRSKLRERRGDAA